MTTCPKVIYMAQLDRNDKLIFRKLTVVYYNEEYIYLKESGVNLLAYIRQTHLVRKSDEPGNIAKALLQVTKKIRGVVYLDSMDEISERDTSKYEMELALKARDDAAYKLKRARENVEEYQHRVNSASGEYDRLNKVYEEACEKFKQFD